MEDVISTAVTLILGAALGLIANHFVERPKLRVGGSGSGGGIGPGFHQNNARIWNGPALIGIRVGHTALFGKTVLPPIEWGLTVQRKAAQNCTAWMLDDKGEDVGPPWWETFADGERKYEQRARSTTAKPQR